VLLKKDIKFIKENIAPRKAPVLSIYLNVNPAEPTNANRAWLVRVKDSLKGLDVPREVREKVMRELEITRPAARRRHIEAWVDRFYRRAATILEKLVAEYGIDAVIFMGPENDTHFFEQYLSRALRNRVTGHAPSLPKSNPSPGEVLQKVAPVIAEKLQAAEMALLDEIRDIGRWTIPTVLKELQMGRFHLLVAPWNPNASVLRCAGGLVVTNQDEAEAYCPRQRVEPVALRDLIVDLATAHGARLEFVHGEAESRLLREFGLAALSRW